MLSTPYEALDELVVKYIMEVLSAYQPPSNRPSGPLLRTTSLFQGPALDPWDLCSPGSSALKPHSDVLFKSQLQKLRTLIVRVKSMCVCVCRPVLTLLMIFFIVDWVSGKLLLLLEKCSINTTIVISIHFLTALIGH